MGYLGSLFRKLRQRAMVSNELDAHVPMSSAALPPYYRDVSIQIMWERQAGGSDLTSAAQQFELMQYDHAYRELHRKKKISRAPQGEGAREWRH